MSLGPFFRRELATSTRSLRAFSERRVGVLLAGLTVLGFMALWDKQGWDRSSILGAHRFGLLMFALMVAGMVLLAFGVVVQEVASSIASERDRKTLDALLATRFSSTEIVLGAVATGLIRYANAVAAGLPVVVLVVYLGGVVPIWAVLAGVGLASTAALMAGFSVAASAGARTRARAVVVASSMFAAWFALPPFYLILLRGVGPDWQTSIAIAAVESSPMGLLMQLIGLIPRVGGPVEAVARMVAWQLAWTLVLVAWAVVRLRPASRALYDVEGERGRIKRLKAALRRPPRRPPCSDDPVFWCEAYSSRVRGVIERLSRRGIVLALFAALTLGTWHFARPAFEELAARGYGASPEGFAMPDLNPMLRLVVKARVPAFAASANPGQARLEFNIVLRLFTGLLFASFNIAVFSMAYESIKEERRRDTWLGLLATPLTPREILRGKVRGVLRKARGGVAMLVVPWTVGLLSGAVHPLGFLAAPALLAGSGAFYARLGLLFVLREWDAEKQTKASVSLLQVPTVLIGSVLLMFGPIFLAWSSLLTYEDVAAAIRSGPFPEIRDGEIAGWIGARAVVLILLGGIGAFACGAWWLDRANERGFDALVGRPVRPD